MKGGKGAEVGRAGERGEGRGEGEVMKQTSPRDQTVDLPGYC